MARTSTRTSTSPPVPPAAAAPAAAAPAPPVELPPDKFLTTPMHASYALLDIAASSIFIIPKHTVRSLRSKLDSACGVYDTTMVDRNVVHVLRWRMFWSRLLYIILLGACVYIGAVLGERLEAGMALNIHNPFRGWGMGPNTTHVAS